MANYPLWSQQMAGVTPGNFVGFNTRLAGATISPGSSPHFRQIMWPFNSTWLQVVYELMNTNQLGNFNLRRQIDNVNVGILVQIMQEVATPASPVFFFDVMAEPVSNDEGLTQSWADSNLAGSDPFVTARGTITISRASFGY